MSVDCLLRQALACLDTTELAAGRDHNEGKTKTTTTEPDISLPYLKLTKVVGRRMADWAAASTVISCTRRECWQTWL